MKRQSLIKDEEECLRQSKSPYSSKSGGVGAMGFNVSALACKAIIGEDRRKIEKEISTNNSKIYSLIEVNSTIKEIANRNK